MGIDHISKEDAARFIVECAQSRSGGEFIVGGPEIFTFPEIYGLKIDKRPLWRLRLVPS